MAAVTQSRRALQPAVFLDKDGTLVRDVPFNVDPARLDIYPEVPSVLAALSALGYRLIVISNQPGVAHGYFDDTAVAAVGEELRRGLAMHGIPLAGFHYCPHHPQGSVAALARECDCRKPRAGLLVHAAREHRIDLGSSWMIGDILNDVEAGNRAGCRTILVDRGNETEWLAGEHRKPHAIVSDLHGALGHIREHAQPARRELP